MSDNIQFVPFSYAYWPGGSGDLSSGNWIIGYDFDYTTGQYLGLVTGVADSNAAVIFGGALPFPYQSTPTTLGGTLTGTLVCDTVIFQGGGLYDLVGGLSARGKFPVPGTDFNVDIRAGTTLTVELGMGD